MSYREKLTNDAAALSNSVGCRLLNKTVWPKNPLISLSNWSFCVIFLDRWILELAKTNVDTDFVFRYFVDILAFWRMNEPIKIKEKRKCLLCPCCKHGNIRKIWLSCWRRDAAIISGNQYWPSCWAKLVYNCGDFSRPRAVENSRLKAGGLKLSKDRCRTLVSNQAGVYWFRD